MKCISIFYHTHQYLQVTNQMITACKAYITNNGSNSIWDQHQQVVADKIKAAIHLNQVLLIVNHLSLVFLFLHSIDVIWLQHNVTFVSIV